MCLCVCVHACTWLFFFFNPCLSCFECWNLDGVFFRKPSLANIHDQSLLLLLTHCLHFLSVSAYLVPGPGPGRWACWQTCWWRTWVQVVRQLFDTAGALHVGHLHCQKHRGILFMRLKNSHSEWLSECQPRRFWVRVCFNQPMISYVRRWHWDSLSEGRLNIFLFLS